MRIGNVGAIGWLGGAAAQLVNEVTSRIPIPIPVFEHHPVGEILEPIGRAGRAGANDVEQAFDRVLGRRNGVDPQSARLSRPIVDARPITVPGAGTSRLELGIAVSGVDWSTAGATGVPLAIYVDGKYSGSLVATRERPPLYRLNVGHLAGGTHDVEVRSIEPLPKGASATVTRMEPVAVDARQALVDRHAPVMEFRSRLVDGQRRSVFDGDLPLFLVPSFSKLSDGGTAIAYRVAFSNEDGGTRTKLMLSMFGRTMDVEPVFRVELNADGSVRGRQFRTFPHVWRPFDGDMVGDRPVIRVSTANGMTSARVRGAGADHWAQAAEVHEDREGSELGLLMTQPWVWAMAGKELLREGKANEDPRYGTGLPPQGKTSVSDPRTYLYLGPLSDAARAALAVSGSLDLRLRDGSMVPVRVKLGIEKLWLKTSGIAAQLPSNVLSDAIVGVVGVETEALVLDAAFGPRLLPTVAR